jgi:hypothetical protein
MVSEYSVRVQTEYSDTILLWSQQNWWGHLKFMASIKLDKSEHTGVESDQSENTQEFNRRHKYIKGVVFQQEVWFTMCVCVCVCVWCMCVNIYTHTHSNLYTQEMYFNKHELLLHGSPCAYIYFFLFFFFFFLLSSKAVVKRDCYFTLVAACAFGHWCCPWKMLWR